MKDPRPHLVIIGGGFAGLWATRALAGDGLRITLVDRHNHHLFQPLLYQVATAGLSAPDIAAPLRHILRRQRNVEVRLAEAKSRLANLAARLANDRYVSAAPAALGEETRKEAGETKALIERLQAELQVIAD